MQSLRQSLFSPEEFPLPYPAIDLDCIPVELFSQSLALLYLWRAFNFTGRGCGYSWVSHSPMLCVEVNYSPHRQSQSHEPSRQRDSREGYVGKIAKQLQNAANFNLSGKLWTILRIRRGHKGLSNDWQQRGPNWQHRVVAQQYDCCVPSVIYVVSNALWRSFTASIDAVFFRTLVLIRQPS